VTSEDLVELGGSVILNPPERRWEKEFTQMNTDEDDEEDKKKHL
jgi:hypothetical protein